MMKWIVILGFAVCSVLAQNSPDWSARTNLVEAMVTEDSARQLDLIKGFVGSADPHILPTLEAWRGGLVCILETNDTRVPVVLDPQTDNDGRAAASRVFDGEKIKDDTGAVMLFSGTDLTPADVTSKLRR